MPDLVDMYRMVFSHAAHLTFYTVTSRRNMAMRHGMLVTSIDVDVGNRVLGEVNKGKNDKNVHDHLSEYAIGKTEEVVVPLLIDFFDEIGVPVTFALRGQLLDVEASMVERLKSSPVKHEIASHSYHHKRFSQLDRSEADAELQMVAYAMNRFSITPKSFVFPRNDIAHLNLLEKHRYICYRGGGGLLHDRMSIRRSGRLYDVHASLYLDKSASPGIMHKIIDLCVSRRLPLHVWFHPWNFGENEVVLLGSIRNVLSPFYEYAQEKMQIGLLSFETMSSAAYNMARDAMDCE